MGLLTYWILPPFYDGKSIHYWLDKAANHQGIYTAVIPKLDKRAVPYISAYADKHRQAPSSLRAMVILLGPLTDPTTKDPKVKSLCVEMLKLEDDSAAEVACEYLDRHFLMMESEVLELLSGVDENATFHGCHLTWSGRFRDRRIVTRLIDLLGNGQDRIRQAAAVSLYAFPRKAFVRSDLEKMEGKSEVLAGNAAGFIGIVCGDNVSGPAERQALLMRFYERCSDFGKIIILERLKEEAFLDEKVTSVLNVIASNDPNYEVRVCAANLLLGHPSYGKNALEIVEDILVPGDSSEERSKLIARSRASRVLKDFEKKLINQ